MSPKRFMMSAGQKPAGYIPQRSRLGQVIKFVQPARSRPPYGQPNGSFKVEELLDTDTLATLARLRAQLVAQGR